jgi:hypothetical protein
VAIDLVTTVGDPAANSYADVDQADERALLRAVSPLAAAWAASSDTERKKSALISATMDEDAVFSSEFYESGVPLTDEQALFFPTEDFPDDYPANLVAATIELAFTLLPTAASEPLDPVVNDKKRVKADDVEVEYFAPSSRDATSIERWPGIVQRLLAPFLTILVTAGVWGTGTADRTS